MVVTNLIKYKMFNALGFPKSYPMNLTVGLSYRCNSRCKTCNIWRHKDFSKEMSLEEYEKIFKNFGKNKIYLLILTGGEPFMHKNITEIATAAEKYLEPGTIIIPTNCILNDYIVTKVKEILHNCKKSHITINLSVDEIGRKHDTIRGIKGNYKKVMNVFKQLKELEQIYPNFDVSMHTVVSKFNYKNFQKVHDELIKFNPSNYITEIAENRVELGNMDCTITPTYDEYSKAIDILINDLASKRRLGLKQSFRLEYYKMVKKILKERKQIIPCYAGIASAQIDPTGEVWMCCVRAESIGNLKDVDYDLMKLWYNEKAKKQRISIRNKECYCPLASANYTNLSLDFKSSVKVIMNLIKSRI